MKTVGIKLLKNNLSRYLSEVCAGETVWITDRDEVIAEIHRAPRPTKKISRWEAWANAQEQSGQLRRAKTGGPSLRAAMKLPKPAQPLVAFRFLTRPAPNGSFGESSHGPARNPESRPPTQRHRTGV